MSKKEKNQKTKNDKSYQMQLVGNSEAYIEGFKRIVEYDENMIVVSTKRANVAFWGAGLSMKFMNKESITIVGKITQIQFIDKRK